MTSWNSKLATKRTTYSSTQSSAPLEESKQQNDGGAGINECLSHYTRRNTEQYTGFHPESSTFRLHEQQKEEEQGLVWKPLNKMK